MWRKLIVFHRALQHLDLFRWGTRAKSPHKVTNSSCARIWRKIPQRAELVGVGMQHPTLWAADRGAWLSLWPWNPTTTTPSSTGVFPVNPKHHHPKFHWSCSSQLQLSPLSRCLWLLFTTVLFSPFLGWERVQAEPHWGAEGYANTFRGFCSHSISDLCNAEPGFFRQMSLLCQKLF